VTRLTSAFRVKAALRRVHDAGGAAMVLARGDATAGAILVVATDRGGSPRLYERGLGTAGLIQSGPVTDDSDQITDYWQRRRRNDPDLWVIELDIAGAERFAAETIALD